MMAFAWSVALVSCDLMAMKRERGSWKGREYEAHDKGKEREGGNPYRPDPMANCEGVS